MSHTPLFLLAASLTASFGCFSPKVSEGVICGIDQSCPASMLCDPLDNKCRFVLRDASPPSFDAEPPAPPASNVRIDPAEVNFGSLVNGSNSAGFSFAVINFGDAATGLLDIAIDTPGAYTLTSPSCQGVALQPTDACTVSVVFSPMGVGMSSAQLLVSDPDTVNESAALHGTGLEPGDQIVMPGSKDLGSVALGSQSSTQTFTVINGNQLINTGVLSTEITDPNFVIGADYCNGEELAPNETCDVDVHFAPSQGGPDIASLIIHSTPGGAATASITAIGLVTLTTMNVGTGQSLGHIQSSPAGIDCGSTCDAGFEVTTVTLTATPTFPAVFKNWVGTDPSCSMKSQCTVAMDVSKTVTANWDYCSPDAFLRCEGPAILIRCANDGSGETQETCDSGCNAQNRRCNECTPGESTCMGGVKQTCEDDGTLNNVPFICDGDCNGVGNDCENGGAEILDAGGAD